MHPVTVGQVSAIAGEFAGRCVQWAAQAALRGDIAAMVTAPLHKEALSAAGAPYDQFPGHTEMLQAAAARLLAKQKPAETADVLLKFLPFATASSSFSRPNCHADALASSGVTCSLDISSRA